MVYKYTNKFSSFTEDFTSNLSSIINSIYPIGGISSGSKTVAKYANKKKKSSLSGMFKKSKNTLTTSNDNSSENK